MKAPNTQFQRSILTESVVAVFVDRGRLGFSTRLLGYALCDLCGNDGIDSSIVTQGNLSSSQIAFCGANAAGSSSDAIVTSTVSESLVSSKNK